MKKAGGALGWSSVQVLSTGTPSGLGEDLRASAGEIMLKNGFVGIRSYMETWLSW